MNVIIFTILIAFAVLSAALTIYVLINLYINSRNGGLICLYMVVGVMIASSALSILATNRVLVPEGLIQSLTQIESPLASLIGKLTQVFSVLLALIIIATNRNIWGNISIAGKFAIVGFLLVSVLAPLSSGFFGSNPKLIPTFFLGPLIFLSVIQIKNATPNNFILALKIAVGSLVIFSLILIPIKPSLVMEPYAMSHISGYPFRFWGLSLHANIMGPIAFLLLITELKFPSINKAIHRSLIVSAIIAIILSQSKTTWLAGVISLSLMFIKNAIDGKDVAPINKMTKIITLVTLLSIMISALFVFSENISSFSTSASFGGGDFSGRPVIWRIAMQEWMNNILFGYGPFIWSPEHRSAIGMNFAFHAHNQFYQTIGETGLVGLISLLVYLISMAVAISKSKGSIREFLVFYYIFLIIRSVSEPSFRTLSAFGGDMIIHFPLFVTTLLSSRNAYALGKASID